MNSMRISTNSKMKLRKLFKKREINEIKQTAQAMKEKFNKDMDSLRKSIQTNPRNKKFLNSNLKHS
jgi:flagellar biosynthesis GTPase FlhF